MTSKSPLLLRALRGAVRGAGLTYAQLAQKLHLSETTVKRMMAGRTAITIDRLFEICEIVGLDFYDLARMTKYGANEPIPILTREQEQALAEDEVAFLVFYLVIMGNPLDQICKRFNVSAEQVVKSALKLESFGILELFPRNKLKIKVYRKVRWNWDGPLHRKYLLDMAQDFVSEVFRSKDATRFFFNCPLSPASREVLLQKLKELTREIERLSEIDMNLKSADMTNLSFFLGVKEAWFPPVCRKYLRRS